MHVVLLFPCALQYSALKLQHVLLHTKIVLLHSTHQYSVMRESCSMLNSTHQYCAKTASARAALLRLHTQCLYCQLLLGTVEQSIKSPAVLILSAPCLYAICIARVPLEMSKWGVRARNSLVVQGLSAMLRCANFAGRDVVLVIMCTIHFSDVYIRILECKSFSNQWWCVWVRRFTQRTPRVWQSELPGASLKCAQGNVCLPV